MVSKIIVNSIADYERNFKGEKAKLQFYCANKRYSIVIFNLEKFRFFSGWMPGLRIEKITRIFESRIAGFNTHKIAWTINTEYWRLQ